MPLFFYYCCCALCWAVIYWSLSLRASSIIKASTALARLGAAGSYPLTLMVISHLQMHQRNFGAAFTDVSIGELLVHFFQLYGTSPPETTDPQKATMTERALIMASLTGDYQRLRTASRPRFNYDTLGISVRGGGSYFPLVVSGAATRITASRQALLSQQRAGLVIEDPQEPHLNAARACYAISRIRQVFTDSHKNLCYPLPPPPSVPPQLTLHQQFQEQLQALHLTEEQLIAALRDGPQRAKAAGAAVADPNSPEALLQRLYQHLQEQRVVLQQQASHYRVPTLLGRLLDFTAEYVRWRVHLNSTFAPYFRPPAMAPPQPTPLAPAAAPNASGPPQAAGASSTAGPAAVAGVGATSPAQLPPSLSPTAAAAAAAAASAYGNPMAMYQANPMMMTGMPQLPSQYVPTAQPPPPTATSYYVPNTSQPRPQQQPLQQQQPQMGQQLSQSAGAVMPPSAAAAMAAAAAGMSSMAVSQMMMAAAAAAGISPPASYAPAGMMVGAGMGLPPMPMVGAPSPPPVAVAPQQQAASQQQATQQQPQQQQSQFSGGGGAMGGATTHRL